MLRESIQNTYGINCQGERSFKDSVIFNDGENYFVSVPFHEFHYNDLNDISNMAQYLASNHIRNVGQIVPTTNGQWTSKIDEVDRVLIFIPNHESRGTKTIAEQLSQFHHVGSNYRFNTLDSTPYDKWPEYWASRIDQLEEFRYQCLEENRDDDFSHWFLTTYPYYMALAENAIQYAVDLRIDEGKQEQPTICHHRFYGKQWNEFILLKNPKDWVIDHPSRDLAEWIRYIVLTQWNPEKNIQSILAHYNSERGLSSYSLQLIYNRLLFPIHYVEAVEDYYLRSDERSRQFTANKLLSLLNYSHEYEGFLKEFPHFFRTQLKSVSWL